MSNLFSKCAKSILKGARKLAKLCNKPKSDYQKWRDRLDEVNKELLSLDNARRIFLKLSDVVDKNTELHKYSNGLYFNWLIHNYCVRLGMGIRRLADRWPSKNLNLRNLLKEIEASPETLCVDSFVSYYPQKTQHKSSSGWGHSENDIRKQAHRAFEDALGKGKTAITKKEVKADLKKVWNTAKPIIDYVNENFAHMGQFDLTKPIPIIDDAHRCLDLLLKIYNKYALLLGEKKLEGLVEESFSNWDAPFRMTWIEDK